MRKLSVLLVILVLSLQGMLAQERQITGKVTSSEDGLPMIGVAVMDKQSMRGVATNADGEFSIRIDERTKSLQFSYVGYKTIEVPITGNSMTVVMDPDFVAIDEVMVVAYGTGKKSTFTGSATVVKSEALEKITTSNITQALQGQSSGVQVINSSGQPGDSGAILIRGIGSMNASSSPLYVVDGVAYDGIMNAINPADVESMTVLKDASATALYGSRAANGVIMITTKKGSSDKGQVNFRSTWGYSNLAVDLPRALTPQEFTTLTWWAMRNGRQDQGYTADESNQYATNYLKNELKINPFSIDQPVGLNGEMDPNAQLLFWGDWRDEILKSRLRQEYNLDFSGKNDKADYYFSGGYVNDKGIFAAQKFERFSLRSNLNYQVKNWLKVGTNTSLSHSIREVWLDEKTIWFLRTISPTYPVYVWDPTTGDYQRDGNGNKIFDYGDDRAAWTAWNPLADAAYNPSPETTNNISTRNYIEITFLPELKFRTNFSVDHYSRTYDGYTNPEYGFASGYGGEVYKEIRQNISYTINNLLTYDKTFGDHRVNVLLGQEAYALHYKYLQAAKRGLPFLGLTEIDSASEMNSMSSYSNKYRLLSWLSRVEYEYKDRYYVSGSFRTDGSSRFHPDSRWGKFWSLGASWRISNEEFMSSYDWLDNLKLKASYGAVGNDQLNTYYAYQGLYATGNNDYNEAGVRISRLANKDLKWETNLQLNVGLEFALFNKLSGEVEWFKRKSKDLLFGMPMAPSTGFSSIDRNIGDVQNQGIEFQLSYTPFHSKDFRWSIDFNGTHYKNKITKLPQDEINSGYFKWREGESRYNFWGIEYAGVNPETGRDQYWKNIYETQGDEQVVTGREKTEDYNAVTSDKHKKYLGDAIPKLFGGLTNNLYYKGIDLSFMLYYSIGGKLYDGDYAQMMAYRTGYSMHPDMLKGWSEGNTNASLPRISTYYSSYMGSYTTKFLYDNSFLRLRNLTVGYTLPKSLTSRFDINSLRLFVQGDNLLTLGNAQKRGTDPEQSVSGTTSNRFPTTKSISFGIQLNL
ncbi:MULTISPECIES: TonB-dependent receptor [unclassified Parabacteroides]|uniref:SusC/RagA family TonB-linked outer membrane protein n=1 Tax=unclassified Parabacteroides TaxID=2649774 RepID=UPI0024759321|nr:MULTISPECIES: TonB-dependent receptor [unclassified Parabacteroides]